MMLKFSVVFDRNLDAVPPRYAQIRQNLLSVVRHIPQISTYRTVIEAACWIQSSAICFVFFYGIRAF